MNKNQLPEPAMQRHSRLEYMQEIVDQLRNSGQTVGDEDLARIWPLLHGHILPNRIYDFAGC
jgi:hypothetical protein